MSKIFLSYRREDSRLMCDRIYDALQRAFGRDDVFRDIDNIPPGVVFPTYVASTFATCKVILVLIGPDWLTVTDETGRRLENPDDYVRIEIENALRQGIPIIPLLVLSADMPKAEQLPQSIQQLAMFNAQRVRPDPDFQHDMAAVIKGVARYVPTVAGRAIPRRLLIGATAGISVIALGGLAIVKGGSFFGSFQSPVASYPNVSGTWNGTLTILTNNGPTGDIQLTLHQQQAHLTGDMTFQPPLSSNNGAIDGAIDTDSHVKLTLTNYLHTETLLLDGTYVQSQDTLSGTYTTTHGYSGTWQVSRSATASNTQ